MVPTPNIFLVGPMACGKSALGEHLAARLKHEFRDSDDWVQARTGLSVAGIFEKEGEARFREYETEAIAELTQQKGIVLATGGGSVLSQQNRRCLQEHGTIVYLQIGIVAQLARIGNDRSRPLLKDCDKRTALEKLNRQREDHYRRIANIVISVDNKSICDIGDEIINALHTVKTDA